MTVQNTPENLWNFGGKGTVRGLAVGRQKAIVRAKSANMS